MSLILERVREKYPQYSDIPDLELAARIGDKYPTYLSDPDFKAEHTRGHVVRAATTQAAMGLAVVNQIADLAGVGFAAQKDLLEKEAEAAFQKKKAAELSAALLQQPVLFETPPRERELAPGTVGPRAAGVNEGIFTAAGIPDVPSVKQSKPSLLEKLGVIANPALLPGALVMGLENAAQVNRSAVNVVKGLADFLTSPVGVATAPVAGGVIGKVPALITKAWFIKDLAVGASQQAGELWETWDSLSESERVDKLVHLGATTAMAGGLAKHSAAEVRPVLQKFSESLKPETGAKAPFTPPPPRRALLKEGGGPVEAAERPAQPLPMPMQISPPVSPQEQQRIDSELVGDMILAREDIPAPFLEKVRGNADPPADFGWHKVGEGWNAFWEYRGIMGTKKVASPALEQTAPLTSAQVQPTPEPLSAKPDVIPAVTSDKTVASTVAPLTAEAAGAAPESELGSAVGREVIVPKKLTTSSVPVNVPVRVESVSESRSRTGKRIIEFRFDDGVTVGVQVEFGGGEKPYTYEEAFTQAVSRRNGRASTDAGAIPAEAATKAAEVRRTVAPLTAEAAEAGLREVLPEDFTTDIRKKPIEIGGPDAIQKQAASAVGVRQPENVGERVGQQDQLEEAAKTEAKAPELMTPVELERFAEEQLGKQGEKGSAKEDWREIQDEIDSGKTRTEALREWAVANAKAAADMERDFQLRKAEFSKTERAENATLTPEQWAESVAPKLYEQTLARFKRNGGKGKFATLEQFKKNIGTSNHEMEIRDAMLHEQPVSAAAVDAYGIKLHEGYVREGDRYVYKPEAKAAEVTPAAPTARTEKAEEGVRGNPALKIIPEGFVDFDILENPRLGLREPPPELELIPAGPLPEGTFYKSVGKGYHGNRPSTYAFTPDGRVYDDSGRSMTHGGSSPWVLRYVASWFKPKPPPPPVSTEGSGAEQSAPASSEFKGMGGAVPGEFAKPEATRVSLEPFKLPAGLGSGFAIRWAESHSGRRLTVATGFKSKAEAIEWINQNNARAGSEKLELVGEPPAPQGQIKGMGGATPSEFEAIPEAVSNMFAVIDRDRAMRGHPPMDKGTPRSWSQDESIAYTKFRDDPNWIYKLMLELGSKMRPLLSWEELGMKMERAKLRGELNNALDRERLAREDGRMEDVSAAKVAVEQYDKMLLDLDDLIGRGGAGTEWGRTGRQMQAGLTSDLDLIEMRLRKMHEKGTTTLTPEEESTLAKQAAEWKAESDKLKKHLAERDEKIRELERQKSYDHIEVDSQKKPQHPEWVLDMVKKIAGKRQKEVAESGLHEKLKKRFAGAIQSMGAAIRGEKDVAALDKEASDWLADYSSSKILEGLSKDSLAKHLIDEFGEGVRPYTDLAWESGNAWLKSYLAKELAGQPKQKREKIAKAASREETNDGIADAKEAIKDKARDADDTADLAEKRKLYSEISWMVQKLARLLYDSGVRGRDNLVEALHRELDGITPWWTKRDTQDAFSGYGQYKVLDKEEAKVALRGYRGELQQVSKLEDLAGGKWPSPTGSERRTPTDLERQLIKQVNEAKKSAPLELQNANNQLKSALQARKTYYRNRITDLKQEIRTRERIVKQKNLPPTDAELEALKAEAQKLKAEHDEIFQKPGMTDEQRLKLAQAGVERQIAELERRIKGGDFSKRQPYRLTETPELKAAKARRDALKAEFEELRAMNEGYIAEQRALELEQRKAALEKSISEKEAMLASGDVSVAGRAVNRPADPMLESLLQRRDELNRKILEARKKPEGQRYAEAMQRKLEAMNKRIAEKEAKIAAGDFSTKPQAQNRPLPPDLEQAKQRLEALNKKIAEARKKPESQRYAEALQRKAEAMRKRIAEKEAALARGDIAPRPQPQNRPLRPELEQLKQQLEDVNRRIAEARKPVISLTERAIKQWKARTLAKIAELEERIAKGDFEPRKRKPPPDISEDAEAMQIMGRKEQVKRAFQKGLQEDRIRKMGPLQKTWHLTKNTINLQRQIMTAFDLSAILAQGGFITLANPHLGVRAFPRMWNALMKEDAAFAIEQSILNRPNARNGTYAKAGVEFTSFDDFRLSRHEEMIMGQWGNALGIPIGKGRMVRPIRASNRAFSTYLNVVRAEMFDKLVEQHKRWFKPDLTEVELKAYGNFVNIATGRGNLMKLKLASEGLATFIFSPRLVASRFQLLLGEPLMRGDMQTRALVAAEYAKFLGAMAIILALSRFAGAEVETDPRSSDAGKIKVGDETIDLWTGLAQVTTFLARVSKGETKTRSGEIKKATLKDTLVNFFRNKLAPAAGQAWDIADILHGDKPPAGHPQTLAEVFSETHPLSIDIPTVKKIAEENGIPHAVLAQMLQILGARVQAYDEQSREFRFKPGR